ncbi:MAG: hypothetical protein R2867_31725 [Caldilineaceae bacterium]
MQIHQHRLSVQGWLALLTLILTAWFMIDNLAMLLELTWILFGAFILGVMIRPVADRLVQWRIPRGITVLLAYISLLTGLLFDLSSAHTGRRRGSRNPTSNHTNADPADHGSGYSNTTGTVAARHRQPYPGVDESI